MKSVVYAAVASLCLIVPPPAVAQERVIASMLTDVCLPYANRGQSFEKAIRAARELGFRRPFGDTAPLEEWASEINLISHDGNWMIRIEEGGEEDGDAQVYAVSCSISSRHASARELADLGRRAFGDPERWHNSPENPRRWERRTRRPEEYRLVVRVTEPDDQRPALVITGLYY